MTRINNFEKNNEWKFLVETKSNEELILILTNKADYEPAFVIAANEEFEKRNLNINELLKANLDIDKKEEIVNAKATERLEKQWRFLIIAFPFLPKLFLWDLRNYGYHIKADEADFYAKQGYFLYRIILVILFVLVILL